MRCFNKDIDECGLFDPLMDGGKYTWVNNRAATRIDSVLLLKAWMEILGILGC